MPRHDGSRYDEPAPDISSKNGGHDHTLTLFIKSQALKEAAVRSHQNITLPPESKDQTERLKSGTSGNKVIPRLDLKR